MGVEDIGEGGDGVKTQPEVVVLGAIERLVVGAGVEDGVAFEHHRSVGERVPKQETPAKIGRVRGRADGRDDPPARVGDAPRATEGGEIRPFSHGAGLEAESLGGARVIGVHARDEIVGGFVQGEVEGAGEARPIQLEESRSGLGLDESSGERIGGRHRRR